MQSDTSYQHEVFPLEKQEKPDLIRRAERHGVRLATPRTQVMGVIDDLGKPFSASELLDAVEQSVPSVGRATVFRTLQLLCDLALVERVRLEDGQDVYVTGHSHTHHHHLICKRCDDIQEMSECGIDEFVNKVADRHGFVPEDHTFDIYGVCPNCRAEAKA